MEAACNRLVRNDIDDYAIDLVQGILINIQQQQSIMDQLDHNRNRLQDDISINQDVLEPKSKFSSVFDNKCYNFLHNRLGGFTKDKQVHTCSYCDENSHTIDAYVRFHTGDQGVVPAKNLVPGTTSIYYHPPCKL